MANEGNNPGAADCIQGGGVDPHDNIFKHVCLFSNHSEFSELLDTNLSKPTSTFVLEKKNMVKKFNQPTPSESSRCPCQGVPRSGIQCEESLGTLFEAWVFVFAKKVVPKISKGKKTHPRNLSHRPGKLMIEKMSSTKINKKVEPPQK